MKHIISLIAVSAFLSTPSLIAQEHERGERNRPDVRRQESTRSITVEEYRGIERQIRAAIESGRISAQDAEKRLLAARRMIKAEEGKRPDKGKKDKKSGKKQTAVLKKQTAVLKMLAKQIKSAVDVGLMDEAEAKKILLRARKRIDKDGKKSRKPSRKSSRKSSPKSSRKSSPKPSRKSSRKSSPKSSPKPSRKSSQNDHARAEEKIKKMVRDGKVTRKDAARRLEEMRRAKGKKNTAKSMSREE